MRKPVVVVVSEAPGTGKTTLGRQVAQYRLIEGLTTSGETAAVRSA